MKVISNFVFCVLQAAVAGATFAGVPKSYRNPIWADIPDMGLCSDGKHFYMVSTTMHLAPGAPIMQSDDMVHWKTISYAFPRLPDNEPRYNLGVNAETGAADGTTAYGQGQWASSLRYHDGKFYLWFVMNGTGGFIYTADKAEGPWKLHSQPGFMHDGSLFFDDDGSAYIAHGDGWITALTPDLKGRDEQKLNENKIDRRDETALLEGTSMFKHDGWYYRMMVSAFMPGIPRREVCYRSRSLRGPWEKKVILQTEFDRCGGVGQGCVVERNGEWWALVFQDRGGVGRVPCVMPVVWTDGWPMLGNKDGSAIPNDTTKPYADVSGFMGTDEFDGRELSLYWQWNHNPVDGAWSLAERPGWMRLKTARVVKNLYLAPNTLTQRTCGPMCNGAVKIDTSNMKDGDVCGLAAFQGESATLNVIQAGGQKVLLMRSEKSVMDETDHRHAVKSVEYNAKETVDLTGDVVYLRARLDYHWGENWAYMDYSTDGVKWRQIGDRVRMVFDLGRMFMGTKFAIFNYATKETGGWVDVDWFRLETLGHEEVQGKLEAQVGVGERNKAKPFELGAVTLDGGPLKARRDVDVDYLLNTVKVDRLLHVISALLVVGIGHPDVPYFLCASQNDQPERTRDRSGDRYADAELDDTVQTETEHLLIVFFKEVCTFVRRPIQGHRIVFRDHKDVGINLVQERPGSSYAGGSGAIRLVVFVDDIARSVRFVYVSTDSPVGCHRIVTGSVPADIECVYRSAAEMADNACRVRISFGRVSDHIAVVDVVDDRCRSAILDVNVSGDTSYVRVVAVVNARAQTGDRSVIDTFPDHDRIRSGASATPWTGVSQNTALLTVAADIAVIEALDDLHRSRISDYYADDPGITAQIRDHIRTVAASAIGDRAAERTVFDPAGQPDVADDTADRDLGTAGGAGVRIKVDVHVNVPDGYLVFLVLNERIGFKVARTCLNTTGQTAETSGTVVPGKVRRGRPLNRSAFHDTEVSDDRTFLQLLEQTAADGGTCRIGDGMPVAVKGAFEEGRISPGSGDGDIILQRVSSGRFHCGEIRLVIDPSRNLFHAADGADTVHKIVFVFA